MDRGTLKMIPVDQTFFVGDESGVSGNCLQAVFASVLEKPLYSVPHFVEFEDWIGALYLYLDGRKLDLRVYHTDPGVESIAVGMSPRGVRHAIVWNQGMVHDPHPSREGLSEEPTEFWVVVPKAEEESHE